MWPWLAQQELNTGILLLAATATGGGLWFVVRLVIRFQREFLEAYAARIVRLETRIDVLEEEREELRRSLLTVATERGALRAVVRQHGIQWEPSDWGDSSGD